METFIPVNSFEIALRAIITDKHTLSWSFYTPLAAADLWVVAQHHPEIDGSDLVCPEGENPKIATFHIPEKDYHYIGLYTAHCRVEEVFEKWNVSRQEWTPICAQGYQLLSFFKDVDVHLVMNPGIEGGSYTLDPDMVEILLSRPEPVANRLQRNVFLDPEAEVDRFLGPVRKFLSQQPTVRAAWIFGQKPDAPLPAGHRSYEFSLVMADPEDRSLLDEVAVMLKALTPLEMEWTTAVMMGDDQSLRRLARDRAPFYEGPDFLKKKAPG